MPRRCRDARRYLRWADPTWGAGRGFFRHPRPADAEPQRLQLFLRKHTDAGIHRDLTAGRRFADLAL